MTLEQLVMEWRNARQAIFDVDPGAWAAEAQARPAGRLYGHLWAALAHAEHRLMDKAKELDGW